MYEYDDYDYDDDYDEYDEYDDGCVCTHCQNTGRVPALDFEAIQGHDYFACSHCERGLNSGFPWRR